MKHLGSEVERELARFGPGGRIAEVVEAWPAAVGETIARNAWPARVARDGTLHVNTTDSVWAFELGSRASEIAQRLCVDRIRFAPGRLPDAPKPEPDAERESVRPIPERALQEGRRLAAGIEDENLRKIVARAVAASLARSVSDRFVW